jgi:hypothetical protein
MKVYKVKDSDQTLINAMNQLLLDFPQIHLFSTIISELNVFNKAYSPSSSFFNLLICILIQHYIRAKAFVNKGLFTQKNKKP